MAFLILRRLPRHLFSTAKWIANTANTGEKGRFGGGAKQVPLKSRKRIQLP